MLILKKILIVFVLLCTCLINAHCQIGISVRPYGRLGVTLLFPTLEELEYGGNADDWSLDKKSGVVGVGAQFVFKKSNMGIGIDIGNSTLFSTNIDVVIGGVTMPRYHKDAESNSYFILFTEYSIGEYFLLQTGLGPHIISYEWEFYVNGYLENSNYDKETNFALMVAAGVDIPVHRNFSFFLLGKIDAIFRYGITLPLTFNCGASLNL